MQNTTLLPSVLDRICSVDAATCSAIMDNLASSIIDDVNGCGKDLKLSNPVVQAAVNGFRNYKVYRAVGCQKDGQTGKYCFAEAVAAKDPR